MDAVAARLLADAHRLGPQALANVGWGWARLKYTPDRSGGGVRGSGVLTVG